MMFPMFSAILVVQQLPGGVGLSTQGAPKSKVGGFISGLTSG